MSLRINHNTAALNSHRNMLNNDRSLSRTLEHLSSGMKINRAADGPAALVISEQMRAQISGLKQAVMNSETAVSMVQTTEAALNEVNRMLVSMRQLAIHAANEGVNDDIMLEADQAETINALNSIDRIARNSQFGTKVLLDGSNGVSGITTGDNLTFVEATEKTMASSEGGYAVRVDKSATQAKVVGKIAMTEEMINKGEVLTIQEGGKNITYTTEEGDSSLMIKTKLEELVQAKGLKVDIDFTDDGKLVVSHRQFGSEYGFEVTSSTKDVLSEKASIPQLIKNGEDIEGTINGEYTRGEGQYMVGARGTTVEGLKLFYDGMVDPQDPATSDVGRVSVTQNSLNFQIGGNYMQTTEIALPNMNTNMMALNTYNDSGYKSLADIDLRSFEGASDALLMIDSAIDQISSTRASLGAVQKNTLETNITSLRVATESLISSESVIRDTDMAEEMASFTRDQVMMQSATAMLAQANQIPNNVISLLK